MIPKFSITQRLLEKYPFARFIGVIATNIKNVKESPILEKEKRKLEKYITSNFEDYKEDIKNKKVFFEKYKKSFPIEYQLNKALNFLIFDYKKWLFFWAIYGLPFNININ